MGNLVAKKRCQPLSPLSRAHPLIHAPGCPLLHHGVENGEQLSHTGGERQHSAAIITKYG